MAAASMNSQRARCRGLRHDARDRRGRLGDAGVHRLHQAPCFRQRREFERSLGDDGERALGADQQTRQVVTDHARVHKECN